MSITAIWGPPGSGKTTLATDLAFAISKRGRSVCLVSPEPYSELSAVLNIRITDEQSIHTAPQRLGNLKQTVCQADGLLFVLAAASNADAFEAELSGADARNLLFRHIQVLGTLRERKWRSVHTCGQQTVYDEGKDWESI